MCGLCFVLDAMVNLFAILYVSEQYLLMIIFVVIYFFCGNNCGKCYFDVNSSWRFCGVIWKNCSGLSCLCRCGVICFCWYCCGVICCCKCPVRSYFRSYINKRNFLFIYRQGKKVMKMSEQSKISWLICVFTEMLKWILFSWGPRRWNRRFHRCFSSGFATASSVTDEIDGSFF